jgi:hypothetical protein
MIECQFLIGPLDGGRVGEVRIELFFSTVKR